MLPGPDHVNPRRSSAAKRLAPRRGALALAAVLLTWAAAVSAEGKWVDANKRATLYQARSGEEYRKEPNGKYTPTKDETQYGVLVANFDDEIFQAYEVWTSVPWGDDLAELVRKAPERVNDFTMFKLSRADVFPAKEPCGKLIENIRKEVEKRSSKKKKPSVYCKPALVIRAK